MKLEVGKYYKSRDGRKWKCVHEFEIHALNEPSNLCVLDAMNYYATFYRNGMYYKSGENNGDLISEWVEPVEHEVDVYFWVTKEKQIRASADPNYWGTPIAKVKVKFTEG